MSRELVGKIQKADKIIKDLMAQLIKEEDVIKFKLQLADQIKNEISAGFIPATAVLKLLNQLKSIVKDQESTVNDEFRELEEFKDDIKNFQAYSQKELVFVAQKYDELKDESSVDKSKTSKLGRLLNAFIKYKQKNVQVPKGVSLTKLWSTIQILRKTIEKEVAIGGDISKYEASLKVIKKSIKDQLAALDIVIEGCGSLQSLYPNELAKLNYKTNSIFIRIRKYFDQFIAAIIVEEEKEKALKKSFPELHKRYIELRNTVIPNA